MQSYLSTNPHVGGNEPSTMHYIFDNTTMTQHPMKYRKNIPVHVYEKVIFVSCITVLFILFKRIIHGEGCFIFLFYCSGY